MREFIGNPFEHEYEDEDEIDELQGLDGGPWRLQEQNDQFIIVDFTTRDNLDDTDIIDDTDHESDDSDFLPDMENDNTDYDSDYLPDNDAYDPDTDFIDGCDEILGEPNVRYSSEEDDDEELDYVTYPISTNEKTSEPTPNNSDPQNENNDLEP